MNPPTASGIMLSDDLIFFSRVAGTARANGLTVRQVRTVDALLTLAKDSPPSAVILDLQNESLDLPKLLSELKTLPAMPRMVAFGSHVLADALKAARDVGCDHVMPRSQFVQKLEAELAGWLGGA